MSAPQNNFVAISRRPPDIEDYIDMVRRYRSWIIGPMFLGLVVSTVIAFYWDNTYVSHATMRITPQQVSERLVQNTASTQIFQRLEQITTNILSHTNLIGIIMDPQLNLYAKDRAKGKALEDVAADMVKDIHFELTGAPMEMGDHRIASAFMVRFSYNDRFKARNVVNKLVSMYEESNSREQRSQAKQTSSFLTEQLKTAQDRLNAAEGAITKFTVENRGHLPQEYASNLSQLQGLRMQISSATDQVTSNQNQKMGYEAQLRDLLATQKSLESNQETILPGSTAGASADTLRAKDAVQRAGIALAAAKKLYRDDMPEVAHAQAGLEFAQSELDKAEKDDQERIAQSPTGSVHVRNQQAADRLDQIRGEVNTTRTQIAMAQGTIDRKNAQIEEATREMAVVQRAVDASGVNSPEYQRLLHDRDIAQTDVQEASKKQQASATQEKMEDQQAGEKLETLDMATLPETPTEPKREIWASVGTIIGLLVGLVLAGAKEMKNSSLKNLKDVRAYTNLPVLSSIPLLENALLVRRKRRLFWLAWTSAFIVGLVCITASMYYRFVLNGN